MATRYGRWTHSLSIWGLEDTPLIRSDPMSELYEKVKIEYAINGILTLDITTMEALNKRLTIDELVLVLNEHFNDAFENTKPEDRIIVLSCCIRDKDCPVAIGEDGILNCIKCGKCPANDIIKENEEKGMKRIFIVKTFTTAKKVFDEQKPKALFGYACEREVMPTCRFLAKMSKDMIPLRVVLYNNKKNCRTERYGNTVKNK